MAGSAGTGHGLRSFGLRSTVRSIPNNEAWPVAELSLRKFPLEAMGEASTVFNCMVKILEVGELEAGTEGERDRKRVAVQDAAGGDSGLAARSCSRV